MKKQTKDHDKKFIAALEGKEIPILTLDPKWKLLFGAEGMPPQIEATAHELEQLMDSQSAFREKIKEIKRLKKKFLNEIIQLRSQPVNSKTEALIQKNSELVAQANAKIEEMEDSQLGLPRSLYQLNLKLMLQTMDFCYGYMRENTEQIGVINNWIRDVRVELKKQLVRKQESELDNYTIYQYMHQIFGPEVIDLFDMKYDPEKWHPMPDPESGYTSK